MADAVVGTLRAILAMDTASFEASAKKGSKAVTELEKTLAKLGDGSGKLTAQADRMVKAFSGDKLLSSAHNLTAAVAKIGGATKLTATEQERVNRQITDAIAKYTALGHVAPQAMLDLESATRKVEKAQKSLGQGGNAVFKDIERLRGSFLGRDAIGDASRVVAAIQQIGGVSKLTSAEQLRVNSTVTEAIAKYSALGKTAPKAMVDLANATKGAEPPTSFLTTKMIALGAAVGTFASQLALQAMRSIVNFGREAFRTASNIIDLSNKTGESTESIQRMQFVAQQTGSSLEAMTNAAFALRNRLAAGGTSVNKAMEELGKASGVAGLSVRSSADEILAALSRVDDANTRVRLGNALFGRSFRELAASVTEGYATIAAQANIAERAQLEALDRSSDRWNQFVTNTKTNVTSFLGEMLRMFDVMAEVEAGQGRTTQTASRRIENLIETQRRLAMGIVGARTTDIELSKEGAKAQETYAQQLAAAQQALSKLTAAQRAEMSAAQQMGATQDELNDLLVKFGIEADLAEGVLKLFTAGMVAAKKAASDLAQWIDNNKLAIARLKNTLEDAAVAGVPLKVVLDEFGKQIDEAVSKAVIFGQKVPPALMAAAAAFSRMEVAKLEAFKLLDVDQLPLTVGAPQFDTWDKIFDAIDVRQKQSLDHRHAMILEASEFEIDVAKRRGASERDLFALTERLERNRLDVLLGAENVRFEIATRGVDKTTRLYGELEGAHDEMVNHINEQWSVGAERRAALFVSSTERMLKSIGSQLEAATIGNIGTLLFGNIGHDVTGELKAAADEAELDFLRIQRSGRATAKELKVAMDRWRDAEDRANFSFAERFAQLWGGIKQSFVSVLDDMLQHFIKSFLGGMMRSLAGVKFGQSVGNALMGGAAGAALGGGAAAVAGAGGAAASVAGVEAAIFGGGAAAGGGLAGAAAAFATNPWTIGIAAGIGAYFIGRKLFGGGEEAKEVNPRRDLFTSQFGGAHALAVKLSSLSGQSGGGALFHALQKSDTLSEFQAAEKAILAFLTNKGARGFKMFNMGGFVPPGVTQPAILHGGRFGEDIIPRTSQNPQAQRMVTHQHTYIIQAWDGEDVKRAFRTHIIPLHKQALTLNQDDLLGHTKRVLVP